MPIPSDPLSSKNPRQLNRRRFLTTTAQGLGAAALLSHLPPGWAAPAMASTAPEVSDLTLGFIALTDCSPFVIAHEKGFFKKHGINATLKKGANWAAIRDMLSSGETQATHMLIGMPIASTVGLLGSPKKAMVAPWLINRNGQAITLKSEWKGKVSSDPKALKVFADKAKSSGSPLTFAMTFPPGTHAMWLRYYLAAGGVHPDRDISLLTIPPPQMVANMKIGKMDGFCVGEPWNARAIADGIGFTAMTSQDIWKDHPEKVCAFTEDFAAKNPRTVKAVIKALHEASLWLDDFSNRPEQCEIVARNNYIACPKEIIEGRLLGNLDYGDGRRIKDDYPMHFSRRNCNFPDEKFALWWLTQLRRWGMLTEAPDYSQVARRVMRADLYSEAMTEMGWTHAGASSRSEVFFDGNKFDPTGDLEAYARSFAVHSLKA